MLNPRALDHMTNEELRHYIIDLQNTQEYYIKFNNELINTINMYAKLLDMKNRLYSIEGDLNLRLRVNQIADNKLEEKYKEAMKKQTWRTNGKK